MFIFFIKTEKSSERISDASAKLKCCTFPAGRTTKEVCD